MPPPTPDEFGPHNCKDCRKCGRRAAFTEVTVHNGKKIERQLCERCAQDEGVVAQSHQPLPALITKMIMSQASAGAPTTTNAACESCGMTFADFRSKGLLGCPACYEAFEEQLSPLIERAHEGATHHRGKVPARAGKGEARLSQLATLRQELREAVEAEQYERAAVLRDELQRAEQALRADAPDQPDTGERAPFRGDERA